LDLMRLLLLASGDSADKALAPYLSDELDGALADISATLTGYRFGTARYKRTKLLSWLVSLVFHPALQDDGTLAVRSTAKQIDSMLTSLKLESQSHFLRNPELLSRLIADLQQCLEVHSTCTGWSDRFMDDASGIKWQELQ